MAIPKSTKLGVAAAILLVLVMTLVILRNRSVEIPKPTGRYPVARALYGISPEDHPMQVWVWYPARAEGAQPAPYLPDPRARSGGLLSQNIGRVRSHSLVNAAVNPTEETYPAVIFLPAAGGAPWMYASLVEDIASHGYIVIGITPTDSQVTTWVGDVRRVIDHLEEINLRLSRRLNPTKVVVIGHVFGGSVAAEACRVEPRIGSAIMLDAPPLPDSARDGVNQPLLSIWSEPSFLDAGENYPHLQQTMRHSRGPYMVRIRGVRRTNFEDASLFFDPLLAVTPLIGSIDARRGLEITRYYIRRFIDGYEKGIGPEIQRQPPPEYPEVYFLA